MKRSKKELKELFRENRRQLEKVKKEVLRLLKISEKDVRHSSASIEAAAKLIANQKELIEEHQKVIKELIWAGEDEKNVMVERDLFDLVKDGNCVAIASMALEGGNLDIRDKDRWTPLHVAALNGHESIVALLVSMGAAVDSKDANHATPLHVASGHNQLAVAEILLKHDANPFDRTKDNRYPINMTTSGEVVKLLEKYEEQFIKKNTHQLHIFRDCCSSITHYCVTRQYHQVLPILAEVNEQGEDIGLNTADERGNCALHIAVENGDKKSLECLFKCKAYPFVKNKYDQYPADMTESDKIKKMVKEYEEKFIETITSSPTAVLKVGNELLLYCAERGYTDAVRELLQHTTNRSLNIDHCDLDENTALHLAVKNKHEEVAALLLKNGAEMLVINKKQEMPADYIGDNKRLIRIFNNFEHIWVSRILQNYRAQMAKLAQLKRQKQQQQKQQSPNQQSPNQQSPKQAG